ncbi:hypothetical protein GOODEAATRI_004471, partial [Goodea atripinnis]
AIFSVLYLMKVDMANFALNSIKPHLMQQSVDDRKPFLLLFLLSDSRIQSYLLAALESSQHKTPPSLPGGLAPVSKELKELSVRFSRLVNYNKLVFSPFYQKILQNLLTPGESPSTEI